MSLAYGRRAQQVAAALAQTAQACDDLVAVWRARSYQTTLTDGALTELGMTAADLAAFVDVARQVRRLLAGQTTTPGDYEAAVNRVRSDT